MRPSSVSKCGKTSSLILSFTEWKGEKNMHQPEIAEASHFVQGLSVFEPLTKVECPA